MKKKISTSQLIDAAAILMCFPDSEKHYLGSSVGVGMRRRYAEGLDETPNEGFELRIRILDVIDNAGQHEDDIDVSDMLTPEDRNLVLALLKIKKE